ncbi:MAG: hypothetical protein NTU51_01865 [Bacteroidetes bacterium]|nr:hypothetical protein [Bacteroidota bacterium]
MSSFKELRTTRLGDIGEKLLFDKLKKKGYVRFGPENGPHLADGLVIREQSDGIHKRKFVIIEVKTYPHRDLYADTGIDAKDYNTYRELKSDTGLDLYIYFVDIKEGRIYFGEIDKLSKPCTLPHGEKILTYPIKKGGKIYFPLSNTTHFRNLTKGDIKELESLNIAKNSGSNNVQASPIQQITAKSNRDIVFLLKTASRIRQRANSKAGSKPQGILKNIPSFKSRASANCNKRRATVQASYRNPAF